MRIRRALATGLVGAALVGAGLGFANPAVATTLSDNGDGTITVSGIAGPDENVRICASSISTEDCADASFANDLLYVITVSGAYTEGSTVFSNSGSGPLEAGTYTMVPFDGVAQIADALLNVVIGSGEVGESSSGTTATQRQTVVLSINTVDGSSCKQSSVSGIAGAWKILPGADYCTAPASKPGATLLGWATDALFHVEIAQRQVDNGWGAYELFNDEGRLTSVFIPAGSATLLSSDGNLFAIWSK